MNHPNHFLDDVPIAPSLPSTGQSGPPAGPQTPVEMPQDVPMDDVDDHQGPEPMTIDHVVEDQEGDFWLNEIIYQSQRILWNDFCGKEEHSEVETFEGTTFSTHFGGKDIEVHVPIKNYDELTGLELDHQQTVKGFQTEVEGLEKLKVGVCLKETEARQMAKEKKVKLLSSRWVKTQKTSHIVRCRLVVRDFASGAESAFRSGIYAPTSSLDSLRCLLSWVVMNGYWLLTADVSVAFMNAPVEKDACDLVLLPSTFTIMIGEARYRLALLVKKAMNGLRRAPLLWFLELQRVITSLDGQETFEVTLFRIKGTKGLVLVLVYVDDLMIASEYSEDGQKFFEHLQTIWSIKLTGRIDARKKGAVNFLGRIIYRPSDGGNELYMGVTKAYMESILTSWDEKLKSQPEDSCMPRLEELHKEAEKRFANEVLSEQAVVRYRRVLGQLAWAALSRADLSFPVSFLSQSAPTPAAESVMRSFLRWLLTRLHFVQRFPAEEPPLLTPDNVIFSFCDASWNTSSVSGAVLVWSGCAVKFFSRRQEVPALSSAEAEVISMVETAKEMVSVGMLIQTIAEGIPMDQLGFPKLTTGEYALEMKNDAKAALSISSMQGLLRRVRHLELRVAYIQHLHHKGRLNLEHWAGAHNPSDGLTKSCKTMDMLLHLSQAVGLTKGLSPEGFATVTAWIRAFDADFGDCADEVVLTREGE